MDISIIICTRNRCESLRRTLETVCGLEIPPGVEWEVLVVDNNSADDTRRVCDEFAGRISLRYIHEARQGKSHALNTGVRATRGGLILFTDDDVDVRPGWVASMLEAYRRHQDKCFFGGRVVPHWEDKPPAWVLDHFTELLHLPQLDWGDRERFANIEAGELFPGANIAFPRNVFLEKHTFSENVGFPEDDASRGYRVSGEDMEFIQKVSRAGWRGVYVPAAIVAHRHTADRFTEQYLRRWYTGSGMMLVRLEKVRQTSGLFCGAPRSLWRVLLVSGFKYILTRWTCAPGTWLPAECTMALTWGKILEFRRGHG